MTLRDYFNGLSKDERSDFAERAGTSVGYIWVLSGGHRRPSPPLVIRLVIASNGRLSPEGLRPDLESLFGGKGEGSPSPSGEKYFPPRASSLRPTDIAGEKKGDESPLFPALPAPVPGQHQKEFPEGKKDSKTRRTLSDGRTDVRRSADPGHPASSRRRSDKKG